jgi:hypothetical protein
VAVIASAFVTHGQQPQLVTGAETESVRDQHLVLDPLNPQPGQWPGEAPCGELLYGVSLISNHLVLTFLVLGPVPDRLTTLSWSA